MASSDRMGAALLFSEMTPASDFEGSFNRWYDEEHIPVRLACPGFLSAQRYQSQQQPGYLAVYELDETGALSTPEYNRVKENPSELTRRMLNSVTGFTRYLLRQHSVALQQSLDPASALDAAILYAVWFDVPTEQRSDFDGWYDTEHVPILMKSPQWLMVRRFEIVDGSPISYTHAALHYLESDSALSSPERQEARNTPWRARLAAQDWFKPSYSVFKRHGQRQIGGAC